MNTWLDPYTTMLNDCEQREGRLTDWERGFVDSLRNRMGEGKGITAKQIDVLDEIWNRATARG